MTGLAAKDASYLYLSSRSQNTTYRYNAPGITTRYTYLYFTGGSQTRDIAITPEGCIWVATDWTSMPMRLYNTSGQLIDYIDSGLLSSARGVTMDDEGYLWVSDINDDKIYQVDLTEGIEGSEQGITPLLEASSNPFSGRVTISGCGFGDQASINIYDISGSLVTTGPFFGTFVFGESVDVARGIYFARVQDIDGVVRTLRLTSL